MKTNYAGLIVFIFLFLGCKSYKNNYDYIIGKWRLQNFEIIDHEKLYIKSKDDSLVV